MGKKDMAFRLQENNRICVSVRDNGIGISPEQTQSILNNDLNGNGLQEHTTGVGLRNVIGRLRLFYNRDDVMEITSTGSGMGTEVAVLYRFRGGKAMYKIMIADDEGIVIDALKFIIEKSFGETCQVRSAKTGRSVIELAESFRPDIALMDIQMPGINGIEAMKENPQDQ